ncbi:MAG: anti-sigma factor [Chloroflexi bacterium]|nr:anti-sigma factor [Chloroflexota bacterium]
MNCTQVRDLVPSYALGALDPHDREEVEAHLDACPACASSARDDLESAAALAFAVEPVEPPPSLKARTLQRIAETPQAAVARGPSGAAYRSRFSPFRGFSAPLWAASAAAVFSLAVATALLVTVADLRGEVHLLREENKQMMDVVQQQRDLTYTIAIPGMETVMLRNGADGSRARGMMMVSRDHTWGVLVSQGLERREATAYQVWLIRDGQRVSSGVFTVDETGYGMLNLRFPEPLTQYSAVGITMEPAGGSEWPSAAPVLSAQVERQSANG